MHPKSCDEKNNLSSLLQNRNEKGKLITDYYFWDTECTDVACVCTYKNIVRYHFRTSV